MELRPKYSAVVLCVLVIFALSKFSQAQRLCNVNTEFILFRENNTVNATVVVITAEQEEVTASITREEPAGLFSLNGFSLIANTVLDYETFETPYLVDIECTKAGLSPTKLTLRIILENINDNPPVFAESEYTLDMNELTRVDTTVARITATDDDEGDQVFYHLDVPEGAFDLEAVFNPNILVKKLLDYDTTQKITMTLYAQDTPPSSGADVSHTASATVVVNIMDIDNRPPWFQPCTEIEISTSKVCLNSGYQGTVNLTEQATEPLSLTPGPVKAIDGDKGINEAIGYTFLGGNEDGTFEINSDTGSITMLKAVGEDGPIILTVMAYQKQNIDQFATSTVLLEVVLTSKHPPTFVKSSYEGFISEDAGVDSLVLESQTSNKPLRVQATDEDFSNGVNPNIMFQIIGGTEFLITPEGFILMAKVISAGTVDLQMRVVDTTNGESSSASLTIEVTPGVQTTTASGVQTTAAVTTAMTTFEKTTDQITDQTKDQTTVKTTAQTPDQTPAQTTAQTTAQTPDQTPAQTPDQTTAQTTAQTPDQTTAQTTAQTPDQTPAQTTAQTPDQTTVKTTDQTTDTKLTDRTSTSQPDTHTTSGLTTGDKQLLVGGYRTEDMAALGASLAVVIVLCLVCIGLLAYHVNRQNSAWKKLSEASVFRSSLGRGSGTPKEGVQYTNEGFRNDGDSGSMNSKLSADLEMKVESRLRPSQEMPDGSTALQTAPNSRSAADSSSLASVETADVEKEVKPILTKERRAEEGYKAVWFKQDIDPNTKEEVVIIPDTSEPADHDEDDDEEHAGRYSRDSDSEDEKGLSSDL